MRTENVIRNSSFALLGQLSAVILKALTQIVFVKVLSIDYLGLNGLFGNILTVLSLAELGIGSAILFNLYEPIAKKDVKRIKALMNFYKTTYRFIGLFILVSGTAILPFLNYLIKNPPDIADLKLIYELYVINNAVSYFYIYKQSILIASEQSYINFIVTLIKNIVMYGGQIIILLITHQYLPYLITSIICTVVFNIINSKIADKKFPYLIHNDETLTVIEKKKIYKDVFAMMSHKIGGVIVMGTDNLLISKFVGLAAVGIYSNYTFMLSAVKGFLNSAYDALVPSIGNLVYTESEDYVYDIFKKFYFINFYITCLVAIGFSCLANPLINILFGEKYLLPNDIVYLIAFNFYITDLSGIRAGVNKFKTAEGLFWQDRYKPYVESVINLVASILLLEKYGFIGVLLGTTISTLCTGFWIEPLVLFKYGFHKSLREYFKIFFKNICLFIVSWISTSFIISKLSINLICLLIGVVICVFVPSIFILLAYHGTSEIKYFKELVQNSINKVRENE